MQDFRGKVAVVTGGASGIGRAIVERCAKEGMKIVLADVEAKALAQAEQELKTAGVDVLALQTDVSKAEQVEALADKAFGTYGAVHLLFNNAGVGAGGIIWEATLADWDWTLGVNLWGVIYGIKFFVPRMLAQNSEGHIVNTASMAGLISGPGLGIYKVTKHGVVTLSETLYHELTMFGSKLRVSVLCPSFVQTKIADSERNRPENMQNPNTVEGDANQQMQQEMIRQMVQAGIPPQEVADKVFAAISQEKFYILTHPDSKEAIQHRLDDILQERNPSATLPA